MRKVCGAPSLSRRRPRKCNRNERQTIPTAENTLRWRSSFTHLLKRQKKMASNAALWEWLEVWGWVWNGRTRRTAPRRAMRKRFARLNAAAKTRILPLIQQLQTHMAAEATARAAVRPEAPEFHDPTADNHRNDLNALCIAEGNLAQTCLQLRNERRPLPTSAITVAGLMALRTDCVARMEESEKTIADFDAGLRDWRLGQHPAGTPSPTPPPAAPAGAAASNDSSTGRATPPPPTDAWLGAFKLAPGGQATPAVYVRQNRHGQIIDRVCIKDTRWPGVEPTSSFWDPDVNPFTADYRAKQPAEIGALNRLNAAPNSQSIIKLRNWNRLFLADVDQVPAQYRLFLEWCGYGDLYDLSRKYTPYGDRRRWPRPATAAEEDWIPEPFIWACFEQLVNAGMLMQRGSYTQVQGPPVWPEIIHRDLKPENVFLTQNTTDIYKGYPMIKLGDFGMTTILSTSLARRLPGVNYLHSGTRFCFAPEQLSLTSNGVHEIGSKTNVWGIGIILWGLMHSRRGGSFRDIYNRTPNADGDYVPRDPQTATFSADHQTHYSQELRTLVLRCLSPKTGDRPDFDELRMAIVLETNSTPYGVDQSKGLRDADARHPRFGSDLYALKLSEERYAMYTYLSRSLARAPVPERGAATNDMATDVALFGGVEAGGRVDMDED
ncbi:hypothetical protein BST61_g7405 [Cercospora zeina]